MTQDQTRNFITTLYPEVQDTPEGFLNLFMTSSRTEQKKSVNYPLVEADALLAHAHKLNGNFNIYMGIGVRGADPGAGKRGGYNDISGVPALWLEVDVQGPGHAQQNLPGTKEEAVQFVNDVFGEFPPSMIVDSGGGIYSFWLLKEFWHFDTDDERDHAQRLNKGLYRSLQKQAQQKCWSVDNVSDLARVLRLPGTLNVKDLANPRLAAIRECYPARRYDPSDFALYLVDDSLDSQDSGEQNISALNAEYLPSKLEVIQQKCEFIKHCIEDAKILSEIEWYIFITIVGRCADGIELAHKYSQPHPRYSQSETQRKIEHALNDTGPYTCKGVQEKANDSFCITCQHNGNIKSPISLGRVSVDSSEIHQAIDELNSKHAGIMAGGKFCILTEIIDPITGCPDITLSTVQDFNNLYANQLLPDYSHGLGKPREVSIAELWRKSPDRREYKGLVFAPGKDFPDYYNLFRGFPVQPKQGDWSLFHDHILNIICSGDQTLFQYVLTWLARILQDPGGNRPGTALVLMGLQGTGKSLFAETFGSILNQYYLQISNQQHLVGQFSGHLKDKLLVFLDEAFFGNDKRVMGTLKALITEPTFVLEMKGKDAVRLASNLNLIIASNNDQVVSAAIEERRFVVLKISDVKMQDTDYFQKIVNQIENGGREAMMFDLLHHDITRVNLRQIPRTDALIDQIVGSMDTMQKYWYECLRSGNLYPLEVDISSERHPGVSADQWVREIRASRLYGNYCEFAKSQNERYPISDSQFGRKLKSVCPGVVRRRRSIDEGQTYCYAIPALTVCRRNFEEILKRSIDWEDGASESGGIRKMVTEKKVVSIHSCLDPLPESVRPDSAAGVDDDTIIIK